ncbi:MAG: RNA polymerase, sigma-24 subunit, ECF subfamily [Parcubacteria group bacterium GW2011_GWE1_40_20]|nr:MAG: RNA polymerase, sigma-24 subunit, ECF subfamily [Parcubacteria group bacterium GW2011_GWE1_40_20]
MKDVSKLSDEKIVELVCKKDRELYVHIIKRYQNKLMRYVNYLIGDENHASDIVQDSFIKAYINLKGFDTKKKFSSWIYRIVHNEAMNIINKQKKQTSLYKEKDFDSGIDIESDFIKKELKTRAHNCLNLMAVIYKEPLSLYYLEEKSYEEISDILKIPAGTVGTRINRAKIIMKKICQKTKK